VLLAHEVLDALAVERIMWDGTLWRRQAVVLHEGTDGQPSLRLEPGETLEPTALTPLEPLGLWPPNPQRPAGFTTELHPGLAPWLMEAAAALAAGQLLVIDYALEAWRYYAPQRCNGTLMAYRQQRATDDPLLDPGQWDLTAHLCLESLQSAAAAAGWHWIGQRRQGEALLALGLAQRLHDLQRVHGADLPDLLSRREALLRLVDPATLGDFRWVAMATGAARPSEASEPPSFLQDPPLG
jgi:SAM-dependent MidA family methyltransferase